MDEAAVPGAVHSSVDQSENTNSDTNSVEQTLLVPVIAAESLPNESLPVVIRINNIKGELFVCHKCNYKTKHRRYYSHHESVCIGPQHNGSTFTHIRHSLRITRPGPFTVPTSSVQTLNRAVKVIPINSLSPSLRLISPKSMVCTMADFISRTNINKICVRPFNLASAISLSTKVISTTTLLNLPKQPSSNKQKHPSAINLQAYQNTKPIVLHEPKPAHANSLPHSGVTTTHYPVKSVQCTMCTFRSVLEEDVQEHTMCTHIPFYSCNYCSFQTKEQDIIRSHLEYHCQKRPPKCFTCSICNTIITKHEYIQMHFTQNHPHLKPGHYPVRQGYLSSQCTIAPAPTKKTLSMFKQNVASINNPPNFESFEFEGQSSLACVSALGCPPIKNRSKNSVSQNLSRSMASTKGAPKTKNHMCQFCSSRSTTPYNLKRHIKLKHPEMVEGAPRHINMQSGSTKIHSPDILEQESNQPNLQLSARDKL